MDLEAGVCRACARSARLVFAGPGRAEWVLGARSVLGRAPHAAIRLPDREVSKEHAVVERADGRFHVRDLGSANGTFVNGRRVRGALPLAHGDEVRVGTTRLRFVAPEPAAAGKGVTTAPEWEQPTLDGAPPAATPAAPVTVVPGGSVVATAPVEPDLRFRPASEIGDAATLRRDYEKLRLAHEYHRAMVGAVRPAEVAERVLSLALAVLSAEGGAVLLASDGEGLRPVASRAAQGDAELLVSSTLVERAFSAREAVLSADALVDGRLADARSIVSSGLRSVMAVPLPGTSGEVRGVLVVQSRRAGAFVPKDLDLLAAVAAQAGVALENAVLAQARDRLARFLPPALVEEAARGAIDLARGGQRVEATALFADLRGFTSLAESLTPEATVALLNAFFEAMADEVFAAGGVLDKLVGDGLLALFGVPRRGDDAGATAALACALRMQQRLAAVSAARSSAGEPPLAMGIGIDTGRFVVGAMGCERRLDYTAIGDPVNVASRLCAAAAPGVVLCGEATARAAGGAGLEPIAPLDVKGKARPVRAFRVRAPSAGDAGSR